MTVDVNGSNKFWITMLVGIVSALLAIVGTIAVTKNETAPDKYLTVDRYNDFVKQQAERYEMVEKELAGLSSRLANVEGSLNTALQRPPAPLKPGKLEYSR